jgi:hypothetical protein
VKIGGRTVRHGCYVFGLRRSEDTDGERHQRAGGGSQWPCDPRRVFGRGNPCAAPAARAPAATLPARLLRATAASQPMGRGGRGRTIRLPADARPLLPRAGTRATPDPGRRPRCRVRAAEPVVRAGSPDRSRDGRVLRAAQASPSRRGHARRSPHLPALSRALGGSRGPPQPGCAAILAQRRAHPAGARHAAVLTAAFS